MVEKNSSKGRSARAAKLHRKDEFPSEPGFGVVDWLLGCPEPGFFVPVESESTDAL